MADRMRADLDKAIDDVPKGVEGATGRLEGTGDDLLNRLADGVGDLLAGTTWIGGHQFTFGFDLKIDKMPVLRFGDIKPVDVRDVPFFEVCDPGLTVGEMVDIGLSAMKTRFILFAATLDYSKR